MGSSLVLNEKLLIKNKNSAVLTNIKLVSFRFEQFTRVPENYTVYHVQWDLASSCNVV